MKQGVTDGQITTENNSMEENTRNPSYIPAMSSNQGVDYSHPLFLSPTDINHVNLISFQIIGI